MDFFDRNQNDQPGGGGGTTTMQLSVTIVLEKIDGS